MIVIHHISSIFLCLLLSSCCMIALRFYLHRWSPQICFLEVSYFSIILLSQSLHQFSLSRVQSLGHGLDWLTSYYTNRINGFCIVIRYSIYTRILIRLEMSFIILKLNRIMGNLSFRPYYKKWGPDPLNAFQFINCPSLK